MSKQKKHSKTYLVGRNASSGQFVSARVAHRHPNNVIVEKIPKSDTVPKQLRYVVAPKLPMGDKKRKQK